MKKALSAIMACLLLTCFISCDASEQEETVTDNVTTEAQKEDVSKNEENEEKEEKETEIKDLTPITYPLNHRTWGVKVLGVRCLESDTQINCDWTCSGIEMNIDHFGGDIVFSVGASAGCYFKAFIDGEVFKSPTAYYTVESEKAQIKLRNVPEGKHTLRLIKVTGYTLSRAQIYSVTFAGNILEQALEENTLHIEYIGDSISCGWGTIGGHGGAFTDQDGTYAYPYLVSEALGADYSVTALSGQGLLVGNPGIPNGYLYGSALRSTQNKYTFARKADVVVINIGTNDYSQKRDSKDAFREAYKNLLETVKAKNGADCKIVCIYNTMNDTFADVIKELCNGKQNEGIYLLEFNRANGGQHPTISEHKGYTNVLVDYLKNTVLK